jgi:hypothetical protein
MAIMKKLARIEESDAGKNSRKGALTGSICANQSNDLSMIDVEGYASERTGGTIAFLDRV